MKTLLHFPILLISFFLLNFLSAKNSFAQNFNNSQLVTMISKVENGIPDTLDYSGSTYDSHKHLLIAGNTKNGNTTDMLITKYALSGAIDWYHTYNNFYNSFDYGTAVCTDDSDNVYVAGTSVTSGNLYDYLIRKYDSSGTVKWTIFYNGPASSYDVATDIKFYGGYLYVTGTSKGSTTDQDYCTLKYNRGGGSPIWTSRYDYTALMEIPASITIASDGNIVVSGGSGSTLTNWDFAVVKYKASTGGDLSVNRSSSSGLGLDQPTDAAIDQSGNIYVCGYASVISNGYDIKVVKLDTSLHTVWTETWDGSHLDDRASGIGVDALGNVYVTGYTTRVSGGTDYITLKYNADSILQWEQTYSATDTTKYARARDLDIDPYGFVLVTGSVYNISNNDFLTLAYDTAGNKMWEEWFAGSGNGEDYASTVRVDTDHVFYVMGRVWSGTAFTYATIKYRTIDFITPPDTEEFVNSLAYYENKGQLINAIDSLIPSVKYYSVSQYPDFYFKDDTQSFVFSHVDTFAATDDTLHRIDLKLKNSLATKIYRTSSMVRPYLNYFKTWCPKGVSGVRGYQRLLYPSVYSNIDLMVYGNEAGIKYYFIIKPGGDAKNIILQFIGDDTTKILLSGDLQIISSIGDLMFEPPTAFQIDTDGSIITLGSPTYYTSGGTHKIEFHTPSYNMSLPMIIEMKKDLSPTDLRSTCDGNICWSTYYGGPSDGVYYPEKDKATDVTTDASGNVYMSGLAATGLFPVTSGAYDTTIGGAHDAFVCKFDNTDMQLWSSFLGSNDFDAASSVRIEPNGEVIIAGSTVSHDFPHKDYSANSTDYYDTVYNNNLYLNGFIASLSSNGTQLKWSTYLQNFSAAGELLPSVYGLAIDKNGNIYAVGQSAGANYHYPVGAYHQLEGGINGTIAMFNASKEVVWSTEFGAHQFGSYPFSYHPNTIIYHAAVGLDSSLYVCGSTRATATQSNSCSAPSAGTGHFPICNSMGASFYQTFTDTFSVDGFIAKFNSQQQLVWSTMFRGSGRDEVFNIDVKNDKIYLTGYTYSSVYDTMGNGTSHNFPIRHPNFQTSLIGSSFNAFVSVFSTSGTLEYSTYLGKANGAVGNGITAHSSGNYFVAGVTQSSNFYNVGYNNYYAHDNHGDADVFISAFNSNNQMYWSTCIGGAGFDAGASDVVTDNSLLYVVGSSEANGFPIITDDATDYSQPLGNPDDGDAVILRAIVDPSFVGIDDVQATSKNSLLIFPNPSRGEFTVLLPSGYSDLKIFNQFGQLIRSVILNNKTEVNIQLNNIPRGIYLISSSNGSNTITKKIIIQ